MKYYLLLLFMVLYTSAYAQNDTLATHETPMIEVYDVVAIYRIHRDGRGNDRQITSEIRGKIINYDQSTGLLTFKGRDGKMYSFSSEEYAYFLYDKEYTPKKKKTKALLPRKNSGYEWSAGWSLGMLNIPTGFQIDEDYVGGSTAGFDLPLCIKSGISKVLNKNSSAGFTAEFSLLNSETTYLNAGARYQFLYNPEKNTSLYFPVELKFSHYQADYYQFQFNDTVFMDGSYQWPRDLNAEVSINALELNIGQGISFALKNKRSLGLEILFLRQFILNEKIKISHNVAPQTDFALHGMKLSAFVNF